MARFGVKDHYSLIKLSPRRLCGQLLRIMFGWPLRSSLRFYQAQYIRSHKYSDPGNEDFLDRLPKVPFRLRARQSPPNQAVMAGFPAGRKR